MRLKSTLAYGLVAGLAIACGSESQPTSPLADAGTGGKSTGGASATTGGTPAANGGSVTSGGAVGNSGGTSSGGTISGSGGSGSPSGGKAATGGNATGGSANPTGGVTGTGGSGTGTTTGGNAPSGGSSSQGGTVSTGGSVTGGSAAGGSANPTGGVTGTGGSGTGTTTGGNAPSGGSSTQGGTVGTGGNASGGSATGGSASGGTSTATGGSGGASEWPQCYATDKLPTTTLNQRAPTSAYTTQKAMGGVAMLIGSSRPSCLTDTVIDQDLTDLNQGIKDVVETLGFPGFGDWKNGYYMNWVILNSGISGATLSGEGGHQGDRWGHMNFESTQQCPCTWDEYNSGAALHECIHALQAELWAFNNQASGWVHEAHNCYLGTMREQLAHAKYTMGYGAAAALQMPHVPVESMGVNTDDSVAGPADQNAKTYVNSIVRYGLEIFFLSLNLEMGRGFINCMWINAAKEGNAAQRRSATKSVFQALQGYAGEEGSAHAVLSFGARSAILDYGDWTAVVRTTMQNNWNNSYWFYMFPGGDGTTTFGPPTKQIPHHQGRNIIPIKLNSGATSVTVEFTPDATGSNGTAQKMQAQLAYRDTSDKPVYGTIFSSGQNTLEIPGGARNGIVNLVVAVTNPSGTGAGDDGSGKGFDAQEHFNYKARIVSGGVIAPTTTRPW